MKSVTTTPSLIFWIQKQEVYVTKQAQSRVALLITDPSLSLLQAFMQGSLTSSQNCVRSCSGRQAVALAGMRLQPFPSPSMQFLGNFQFLGGLLFNSLQAKGIRQKLLFRVSSVLPAL